VNLALVNRGTAARMLMIPGFGIRLVAAPGQTATTALEARRSGEYPFFAGAPGQRDSFASGLLVVTE
jgi:hypothetical protein